MKTFHKDMSTALKFIVGEKSEWIIWTVFAPVLILITFILTRILIYSYFHALTLSERNASFHLNEGITNGLGKTLGCSESASVTISVPQESSKFQHLIHIQSKLPEEWEGLEWAPIKTLGPLTKREPFLGRFPAFVKAPELTADFHAGFRLVTTENFWL